MKNKSFLFSLSLRSFCLLIVLSFLIVSCSSEETVIDIDGNEYKTVWIGNQSWMAENLRVTHFRDGSEIPNVVDGEEWSNLTTGAYCAYENDSSEVITYGFLYNWYAATDIRGLKILCSRTPTDSTTTT